MLTIGLSCKTIEKTLDLVLRTKQALHNNGNIWLHKFASNNRIVLNAPEPGDLSKDFIHLDLGTASPDPVKSSATFDTDTDCFKFKVNSAERS